MRRLLKIAFITTIGLLIVAAAAGVIVMLSYGRAAPARPDLVRLPAGVLAAPRGYPSWGTALVAYMLGLQKIIDLQAEVPVPPKVVVREDVEYGRVGDRPLLLDVYSPANIEGRLPGLIFVHGGGWKSGGKKDYKIYAVQYPQRGYVVALISYRFVQEAPLPACIEDTKCAVRWMRANAAELQVDPDRIAVIGGSAGGHLSLMAAYSSDVPELEGQGGHAGVSSAVAAVVDLYGPTNFTLPEVRDHPVLLNGFKKTYDEAPDLYRLASPITHVDANDPPTLVIQGTIDTIVPTSQSDLLVEWLRSLGVPYYYARLDGWPHTLDIFPEVNVYVQRLMDSFFAEVLAPKPAL